MLEYTKVNVKLSDSQIKKLKDAVKENTGTTAAASAIDAGIQKHT